jgi:hypothetical protein
MRTYRDFAAATAKKKSARVLIRWLLSTGRFLEFRLAERYRAETDQEYQEWAEVAARERGPAGVVVLITSITRLEGRVLAGQRRDPRPSLASPLCFINPLHVGFHPAFEGFYHVILCILEVPLAL